MRTMKKILVIIIVCFALVSCSSSKPKQKKELPTYKIGFMICNSEKETLERFVPFAAYLSKKNGRQF